MGARAVTETKGIQEGRTFADHSVNILDGIIPDCALPNTAPAMQHRYNTVLESAPNAAATPVDNRRCAPQDEAYLNTVVERLMRSIGEAALLYDRLAILAAPAGKGRPGSCRRQLKPPKTSLCTAALPPGCSATCWSLSRQTLMPMPA